jgi:hypothetical protein
MAGFSLGIDPAGALQGSRPGLARRRDEQAVHRRKVADSRRGQRPTSSRRPRRQRRCDEHVLRARLRLISSPKAREAFDIEKEDAAVRDRTAATKPAQRLLMARRLVEAGVRLVTLTYGGWDMHAEHHRPASSGQMPPWTRRWPSDRRPERARHAGRPLVMVSSEFGRTPKINATAGRDHWPKVFSVVLAGGGIKGGIVYGSSNATASEPEDNPVARRLGDHDVPLHGHRGRQGTDGSRRPPDRNRRRWQGDQYASRPAARFRSLIGSSLSGSSVAPKPR